MEWRNRFSKRKMRKVMRDVAVNLASGWLGVILAIPGFFGFASVDEYVRRLPIHLIFVMFGLVIAYLLTEGD